MKILGIETSCDETAAAVVEDGRNILSNVVVSQIDIFAEYGGVIPEVAARSHLEVIMPVISKALKDAGSTWDDIDAIAVTHAPGLLGSLLIGTLTARTLAILHDKPLYAVHHLKSHVYANWLDRDERRLPSFPILALVISGGHTQMLYMPAHNEFEIIGTTHDDAVGECFDKVAKILGLPYPGGPSIAKAALDGDADKYKLPHPKVKGLDFSFSGLKTAVLRAVQKELGLPISYPSHDLKNHLTPQQVDNFAASFQKTAVMILCEKLSLALSEHPDVQSVVVAGGVSANQALREALLEAYFPEPKFSGDNGAMVAAACYFEIQSGVKPVDPYSLNIYPRISIETRQ
ncbi:tRNA (adenosine(37)-N6)-threonylcarbamoyltransferase complex transferase subunit TsaD [Candidatus Saccharibacteria bacterium]|nr:tRNA (adenosine(37)-N6)-threonylcarbamoyltransferase complex transferase subunit TsaD [Candidatus Saccharibacteria bacterium]MBQ6461197.1 tRNA (adenosine(37)-N6)-threonylcarbamoyltransferase complex transferase subunit TsaD [Candidatus Saccharibacteria bacterium]